jgi:hypothetical protein
LNGRICTGNPSAAQIACRGATTIYGDRRYIAHTVLFKISTVISPAKNLWGSLPYAKR